MVSTCSVCPSASLPAGTRICRFYPAAQLRWRLVFSCEVHRPTRDMRAGSPVLSAGRRRRTSGAPSPRSRSLRCHLSGFCRNKSPTAAEDPRVPVLLLQDMNLCYRLLRQLVPGLPPGRAASRVEILQHVIDYILDLQAELDASRPARDRGEPHRGEVHHCDRQQQHQQRPYSSQSSGDKVHTCQKGTTPEGS